MFNILMTDRTFKELDIPLRPAERRELDKQIEKRPPTDSVPTWHGYIMMGYEQYELCEKHHRNCSSINIQFTRKSEAIAWICREQLKRRDLCRQAYSWLLYRLYLALLENANRQAAIDRFQYKQLSQSRFSETILPPNTENAALFRQIGDEYGLTKQTIRNYVRFGRKLDRLEELYPGVRIRVLKGELEVSIIFMDALMQMPREELEKQINDPQCKKLLPPKEIQFSLRKARDPRYKTRVHVETAIKETPGYDPDAELNGLTYTVSTWIKALGRTEETADLQKATSNGKERLKDALAQLRSKAESLYSQLEEAEND